MSTNESQIEKDFRVALEHQGIILSEKEGAIYKTSEELEEISRKTFYLVLKTDNAWKIFFIFVITVCVGNIINIILFQVAYFDFLINRILGPLACVILIVNVFILPFLWYLFKPNGKSLKNKFKEIVLIFSYPFKYFFSIIILCFTFSSIEFQLYKLISSFVDERIKVILYITSFALLFAILIHSIQQLLAFVHKKWLFLSISNVSLIGFSVISSVIVVPFVVFVKLIEGHDKYEILLLRAEIYCITSTLLFVYFIILTQNFLVTKKYKAKYELLLKYAEDKIHNSPK